MLKKVNVRQCKTILIMVSENLKDASGPTIPYINNKNYAKFMVII